MPGADWIGNTTGRQNGTMKPEAMSTHRLVLAFVVLLAVCGLAACGPAAAPTTVVEEPGEPMETVAAAEPTTVEPAEPPAPTEDPFAAARAEMVQTGIIDWGIEDEAVIAAMGAVPRHEFVPEEFLSQAYENHPLPIGLGQTISQPYIVALMSQAVGVDSGDKVLEVGTGSGYQAAVIAELVDQVYTLEIIGELAERAEGALDRLGYDNVTVRHADGYFGWEEQAPFDAILVTAAPDHIPGPLVQQLKIGGRLIIPVGPVGGFQKLWLVTRVSEEEVRTEDLGGVRFVPLTRESR
jgi:protein-L-isoaspartate(D-aspartate) O-methyltransferase